jgi:tetratricopeptide (TPR) repeat protein
MSQAEEKPPGAATQTQAEKVNETKPRADDLLEQEMTRTAELARKANYYHLLGVTHDSPNAEIKRKYYALAKKLHPDLHMDKPQVAESLKDLMEKITEAYQTLIDDQKRTAYDQKLTTTCAFNLERSKTESQETIEQCMSRAQECLRARNFVGSISWLRKCVNLMPHSSKHHAILARSLSTILAYRDQAIFHFEKAIELDPWDTEAHFYLGELYEALKLPWRAQPLYAKILEINPEHAGARAKVALKNPTQRTEKPQSVMSRIFGRSRS